MYDTRQYKMASKLIKQLLALHPHHGGVLATASIISLITLSRPFLTLSLRIASSFMSISYAVSALVSTHTILSAETLAMKSLVLSVQNKRKESFDVAKDALTNDMSSYLCWQVRRVVTSMASSL